MVPESDSEAIGHDEPTRPAPSADAGCEATTNKTNGSDSCRRDSKIEKDAKPGESVYFVGTCPNHQPPWKGPFRYNPDVAAMDIARHISEAGQ